MTDPLSSLSCPPRWGTRRSRERPTLGPRVAQIADALGTPLMPWQRYVADVILELDPATGAPAYREYVITVPRQSGKTTLLLAKMVHRALGFGGRQRILYAAQTRGAARLKWEEEHIVALEASRFRKMFTVRKQLGQEAIRWRNGSRHGITSNTEKAGHGETLDEGVIDEAFAQCDDRIEQAFKPAMITRAAAQQGVVSTAGTTKSTFLRGKVDAGRERCDAGAADTVAYFEWSAPDDADPGDPATWRACMPALGHTVSEAAIRADFKSMKLAEFRRAYLNQWPDAAPETWLVIGQQAWGALADLRSQAADPVAFAVDVTPERSHGAVAVAGLRSDGLRHVEVVEHRPGTGWVGQRVEDLAARWGPCAVVVDAKGPAGSLIAELERRGIEVVTPTEREHAQACGQLFDAVADATLRHLDQPELNAALAGAHKRPLGDAWAWARKGASVDISPLVAVTLAAWGHATRAHLEESAEPWAVWA
jgi:hypothetical protein